MRARDQSSIFSTGGKFRPDYGLLLELHALTLVAHSYALWVWKKVETFNTWSSLCVLFSLVHLDRTMVFTVCTILIGPS